MVTLSIGRQSSCNIVVDDPTVSRRHADLSRLGDDLFLFVDRGSTSGSYRFVEGEWKPFANARLRGRDRIRLGAFETTVGDLIDQSPRPKVEAKPRVEVKARDEARPRAEERHEAEVKPERRGSTYVERDPATGQLLIRTR